MACGPIPLTPQMLSTAMAFFGQNPALPQDLSLVMKGAQPEMKMDVICDAGGRPTGFTLERYFDTKTAITVVVPLDDGEVDEQTSYAHSAADGRVAQKLTVRLDSDYKLASYGVEALCSGTLPNPNSPVCMTHVPTVNGLALPNLKGQHADWMQTFVPEATAGAEYLFVPTAEYETGKKKIEDKRKANAAPPPNPSASATVTAPPVATGQLLPPPASVRTPPAPAPNAHAKNNGPSPLDIGAVALALLGVGGFLLSRFVRRPEQPAEKTPPRARKATSRPNNPHAEAAIRRDLIGDDPIPSTRERAADRPKAAKPVKKTATAAVKIDDDEMEEVLEELKAAKKAETEPDEEDRPTRDGGTS